MREPDNIFMWPMQQRSGVGFFLATLVALLAMISGCDVERRKSDAELGLNPQQSAGRKIYDSHCDRCHEPYSTRGKKGPGLKGVFQNKYLSLSGLPANDERVSDIIRLGRKEMPGYSQTSEPAGHSGSAGVPAYAVELALARAFRRFRGIIPVGECGNEEHNQVGAFSRIAVGE